MKLWTIQPIEVWEEMNRLGYYICNPKKAMYISDEEVSFKESYDWLIAEMEKRIGKRPKGVSYPVWAWHTRDWQHKKPDLRQAGYDTPGTKCVCLELEIPDNQVVLSDYDVWHFVLNDWYFDNSMNEDEWERKHKYYDRLSPEKKLEKKLKSWQGLFDITPYNSDWFCRGRYIQATFWVLWLKDVKKVQFFTAK